MLTRSFKQSKSADPLFVLTCGPGSGKTTLLEALAARGLATMPEAGRAIIREQVEVGGTALPWADRGAFAQLIFERDLLSYHQAAARGAPVVFDRGLPDIAGYLRLCQLPSPEQIMREIRARRYNRRVFIAPPWPEIFAQDTERKQSIGEAQATFDAISETYLGLDYELIPLPLVSIEERAQFALRNMGL